MPKTLFTSLTLDLVIFLVFILLGASLGALVPGNTAQQEKEAQEWLMKGGECTSALAE